ncbi:MAG TPA: hypothetical protein VJA25_06880, partial [Dehalococcoidia bacterium]|nr:hypothetical protein [Dehalococcoidia bacterium]
LAGRPNLAGPCGKSREQSSTEPHGSWWPQTGQLGPGSMRSSIQSAAQQQQAISTYLSSSGIEKFLHIQTTPVGCEESNSGRREMPSRSGIEWR